MFSGMTPMRQTYGEIVTVAAIARLLSANMDWADLLQPLPSVGGSLIVSDRAGRPIGCKTGSA